MIKLITRFFTGLAICAASTSQAGLYFQHTRNEDLKEQLTDAPQRIVPKSDWYSLATDTYLFKPFGDDSTYYHGSGYWVNVLGEVRPHQDIRLNLKVTAYDGASSYGYATTNFLQPFFGLSWDPSFLPRDWRFHLRYGDLDRITFGTGLLLQEKEINGLLFSLSYDQLRYMGIIDGTGGYYVPGDLYYSQIDWAKNLFAFSMSFINYDGHTETLQDNTGHYRDFPMFGHIAWTAFSTHEIFKDLTYRAELGLRNQKGGALAGLEYKKKWNQTDLDWTAKWRGYQKGFADQIAGFVHQEYLTPEVYDKPFDDPRNIFRYDDNTQTVSTRVDLTTRPLWWMLLGSSNEVYSFRYQNLGTKAGYFFKDAFSICPYQNAALDCVSLFVGNKILNEPSPVYLGSTADQSFHAHAEFGAEAFVYF